MEQSLLTVIEKGSSSKGVAPDPGARCSSCKTEPARPNGRYCLKCHAASNRFYRSQLRKRQEQKDDAWRQMTICNKDTEQKFERQIGIPHVLVLNQGGDGIAFAGTVVGFLPEEKLSVMDQSGKLNTVDLTQVRPDKNRWKYE